jgi:2-polyprenyl-6-methoxyphenol hydroxylase-like FAD-dependent oxidoreductase
VFRKHHSYPISSGPDDRIYWSYFFKLAQRAYGDDIPTFTKEDEKKILDARANDNITLTLKFRHLLNTKVPYNSVSLQEYVFRQWYFQRIITIGNAAHKVSRHRGSEFS